VGYLRPGETYKIDVAALTADGTEHSHGLVRGKARDVHTVTVLHVNAHRQASVECECGAQWIFADTGGIGDARYRLSAQRAAKRTEAKSPTTTTTTQVGAPRKRGAYGRGIR
jgi:hypothetical protein